MTEIPRNNPPLKKMHPLSRAGFEEDQASDTCVVYPVSVAVVEMAQVGTVALEVLDRARCPVEDSQRIDESGQARASMRGAEEHHPLGGGGEGREISVTFGRV